MNEILKSINNEFFPTPQSLLEKIKNDFGNVWEKLPREISILEPSAGKGDIAEWFKKRASEDYYWRQQNKQLYFSSIDIDCIEIEPELRSILKGKSFAVVYDNFLTFNTAKHYDLIFMNPPFSEGDRHLLRAINLQEKYGGIVVCILNAETIKNPYSTTRKELIRQLEKYNATIKYYTAAFSVADAERRTETEIAVIAIEIPIPDEYSRSFIFERLDKAQAETVIDSQDEEECREVVSEGLDYLDAYIKQYNDEVSVGIAIIKEFSAYATIRKMRYGAIDGEYEKPTLELKIVGSDMCRNSLNSYVEAIRYRYWRALFVNPKFTGKLTRKMQDELMATVKEMSRYDFSLHNILELMMQIRQNTLRGIEDSLLMLFETCSSKYSYIDESSNNIHYYNGWKTNKAHKVNKKVIIPTYGVWDSYRYSGKTEWSLRSYRAISLLQDLAKALDYIADPVYSSIDTHRDISNQIEINFRNNIASNIDTKYFNLTFYKKGTCHIVFKDDDLLQKFNLYVGRQKAWLPPDYGRKPYKNLDDEERAVADSFSGGEKGYNKIYENQTKYLVDDTHLLMLAEGVSAQSGDGTEE